MCSEFVPNEFRHFYPETKKSELRAVQSPHSIHPQRRHTLIFTPENRHPHSFNHPIAAFSS